MQRLRSFTTLAASGILTSTNATQSTTSLNGAVTTSGGVGVTGSINVGSTITGGSSVLGVTGQFSNLSKRYGKWSGLYVAAISVCAAGFPNVHGHADGSDCYCRHEHDANRDDRICAKCCNQWANGGSFTTRKGSSLAKVFATNTSGQSIPNSTNTTVTGWAIVRDANSNFVASTGIFTAPATADYLVCGRLVINAVGVSNGFSR